MCLILWTEWSFKNLIQFSQGSSVLDSAASNVRLFFGKIHELLQLRWVGICGENMDHVHLETPKGQKIFLSKTNSVLKEQQFARFPASNNDHFLLRETRVHSTQLNRPNWNKMCLSRPGNYDLLDVFIAESNSILTRKQWARGCSFLQGRFSLERYMCFLNSAQKGLFAANGTFLHHENSDFQDVFLSKLTQFSQGINVLDAPISNTDGFLWRNMCVSQTSLSGPIWRNQSLPPPWNT
jgi:hypothetical protein